MRMQTLQQAASGPSSAEVRARVEEARARQRARGDDCNARLGVRALREVCALDAQGSRILEAASERLGLSARAIHRVMKVSRTIADLEGSERVGVAHVAEAIGYRAVL
jgi:magnesium chelatase family protein